MRKKCKNGIEDVNIITPHIGRFEGITAPTFVNTEHIYLDEEGECQYHYLLAQVLATTNVDASMLIARDDVNNSQFFPCVEVVVNSGGAIDELCVETKTWGCYLSGRTDCSDTSVSSVATTRASDNASWG